MNTTLTSALPEGRHAEMGSPSRRRLRERIEHAAHLLPAQGPITAFVHHNTLHALEDLPFEQAVIQGAEIFGCHPYLPEDHYRTQLARGRILPEDVEAVLIEDLGDKGDELLSFFGTRFQLRMAMLAHPLRTGPTSELRWIVAETEALRTVRPEVTPAMRERLLAETQRWILRDRRIGGERDQGEERIQGLLARVFELFDKHSIEQWDDSTWEAFSLHALWLLCRDGAARCDVATPSPRHRRRHRDFLLEVSGQDGDQLVHDLLIPFCAAFLDQGFADWELPHRQAGFYPAFLQQQSQAWGPVDRWRRGLRQELQQLLQRQVGPLESIEESLRLLGVAEEEQQEFISHTLLALRGYAGMIWQLETRGDRVACPVAEGSLVEFLAVRLILDRFAARYVAHTTEGREISLDQLRPTLQDRLTQRTTASIDQHAFEVFQLAQVIGWHPEHLSRLTDAEWHQLFGELASFSSLQRRRIYHLAYERRYRLQTLDAVAIQRQRRAEIEQQAPGNRDSSPSRPTFQIICCIDEREESFRRHVEEVDPQCETLGAAGFFGVAMYYRGAADAHFTPLCPVIIKPQHYIIEDVAYTVEKVAQQRRRRRRAIGTVTHRAHLGSRTFASGWLTATLGSLASIPLVLRILFPRATAQLRHLLGGIVRTPALTKLQLERTAADPGSAPGQVGYNVSEMVAIVKRMLQDMGLTGNLSCLVIVCGHGSSSMNNPHEAAHDCGACGGGRGGPNARAFAQMANDPRVREQLAQQGLSLPADTFFLGAYHNTCDDSVTYYDLEGLPHSHKADFQHASAACDTARARSAHERCRRFESAPLALSADAALKHVEGRAEDLSQVRPEYGHASNALCFVGRRSWSRGLFLDRRAFLQSYEPDQDDVDSTILTRILQAVIPVCAGINLEYYFSRVDPVGYGCGTKLPHNITSLLGVMNGAASDLRPGLPWQMVEIHEPIRLLFVIETSVAAMSQIIRNNEGIGRLVRGNWVQLAVVDPQTSQIYQFQQEEFVPYVPTANDLPQANSSVDWYRGWRDHLGFARITSDTASPPSR